VAGNSLLVRGDNLGSAPGNGVANLFMPSVAGMIGGGTGNGSNTISIRNDIIADTSATGTGTGFATYSAVGGLRPLTASELAPGLFRAVATNSNVAVSGTQTFGTLTVNSLTINGSTALSAINNAATMTLGSSAILVTNATGLDFNNGGIVGAAGAQLYVHQQDAGNLFTFNAYNQSSNSFVKAGPGRWNSPSRSSSSTLATRPRSTTAP